MHFCVEDLLYFFTNSAYPDGMTYEIFTALCGISSSSSLFAKVPVYRCEERKGLSKKHVLGKKPEKLSVLE